MKLRNETKYELPRFKVAAIQPGEEADVADPVEYEWLVRHGCTDCSGVAAPKPVVPAPAEDAPREQARQYRRRSRSTS